MLRIPPITLWDVAAAREVRRFAGHPMGTVRWRSRPTARRWRRRERARGPDLGRCHGSRGGSPGGTSPSCIRGARPSLRPTARSLHRAGADGLILHWDPADGRLLERVGREAGHGPTLAISPDGRTLFVLDAWDGPILWDVAGRKELRRLAKDQGDRRSVLAAFSPDGRMVTGAPWVWDVATGRRRLVALSKQDSMEVSPHTRPTAAGCSPSIGTGSRSGTSQPGARCAGRSGSRCTASRRSRPMAGS